jgi:hypothetical protein
MATLTQAVQLTSKSKTEEIVSSMPELKSGKVLVASIEPTRNPDYFKVMMVQMKKDKGNSLQALALGWDASVERCWMNFHVDQIEAVSFKKSAEDVFRQLDETFDDQLHIRVIHSLEPRKAELPDGTVWTQSPLTREENGQIRTFVNTDNKPIYKNTELDFVDVADETIKGSMKVLVENAIFTA